MARRLASEELKRLALLGASVRLEALRAEVSSILSLFPELRRGAAGGQGQVRPRSQRRMSAAQKREVSLRMKRYWAKRRKGQTTKQQ